MEKTTLGTKLSDIEKKLGGTGEMPPAGTYDPLLWHLDRIESLIDVNGGELAGLIVDVPETLLVVSDARQMSDSERDFFINSNKYILFRVEIEDVLYIFTLQYNASTPSNVKYLSFGSIIFDNGGAINAYQQWQYDVNYIANTVQITYIEV